MLGSFISNLAQPILTSAVGDLFGNIFGETLPRRRTEQGQGTAYERSTTSIPQETQASGSAGAEALAQPIFAPKIEIGQTQPQMAGAGGFPTQAGFGGLIGAGTQLLRRNAPEIFGGLVVGGGAAVAPMVLDAFGQPKNCVLPKN